MDRMCVPKYLFPHLDIFVFRRAVVSKSRTSSCSATQTNVQGRLWQLGVAMATLDAHVRHTALTSEAVQDPLQSNEMDPLMETGGVLLASMVEHVCFAGGAVSCAWRATAVLHGRSSRDRDFSPVQGEFEPSAPEATKMYMALVYPMFFRLLAAFVMIWDRQVTILNTTEMLVATMQFVALSAAVEGAMVVGGLRKRKVAVLAMAAGLVLKMGARGIMCLYFGADPRALRML